MNFQLSYETRQRLEVAYSVAQHIVQEMKDQTSEKPLTASRPRLLSVNNDAVRFEGGMVIRIDMKNIGNEVAEWVVTEVVARYYPYNYSTWTRADEKIDRNINLKELRSIKEGSFGWHHPHIRNLSNLVLGQIGVFFNNAAWDAEVVPDYDSNNLGHYTLTESFSYGYAVGDKERAYKEARAYMHELLSSRPN